MGLILKKKQGDVFQKPKGDISMHVQCTACYAFKKCGCIYVKFKNKIKFKKIKKKQIKNVAVW